MFCIHCRHEHDDETGECSCLGCTCGKTPEQQARDFLTISEQLESLSAGKATRNINLDAEDEPLTPHKGLTT